MLEYTLEENKLTDAPDDFRAQVVNVRSYTQGDIIDRIMRIGAGLTRSDVLSVLEAEKQVIGDIVADGGAVTTELFNAYPSIHGVITDPEGAADKSGYRVNMHPGTALRRRCAEVSLKKVIRAASGPCITSITDAKSGTVNERLTPGHDIKIHGAKLKIAGENPENGLFFVNAASGAATPVELSDLVLNNPSYIIALVPNLPAGDYRVKIVTQFTGSGTGRKTSLTCAFEKTLTVG